MKSIALTAFLVTALTLGALIILGIIIAVIFEYPIIKERQRRNKEEWDRKQAQRRRRRNERT